MIARLPIKHEEEGGTGIPVRSESISNLSFSREQVNICLYLCLWVIVYPKAELTYNTISRNT